MRGFAYATHHILILRSGPKDRVSKDATSDLQADFHILKQNSNVIPTGPVSEDRCRPVLGAGPLHSEVGEDEGACERRVQAVRFGPTLLPQHLRSAGQPARAHPAAESR